MIALLNYIAICQQYFENIELLNNPVSIILNDIDFWAYFNNILIIEIHFEIEIGVVQLKLLSCWKMIQYDWNIETAKSISNIYFNTVEIVLKYALFQ